MAEAVARGIGWWLQQEAVRSRTDHNSVLDNYDATRADYLKASDDPGNRNIKKAESHFMRFQLVTRGLSADDLSKNKVAGRVVHHALMFASGGFRTQCFLQTKDQSMYEWMRFDVGGGTGLHAGEVADVVQENVERTLAHPDIATVVRNGLVASETILAASRSIHSWFETNPNRGQDALSFKDQPTQLAFEVQRAGIGLAASYVAISAVLRDNNFGAVPVWQPESITTAIGKPLVYAFGA